MFIFVNVHVCLRCLLYPKKKNIAESRGTLKVLVRISGSLSVNITHTSNVPDFQ